MVAKRPDISQYKANGINIHISISHKLLVGVWSPRSPPTNGKASSVVATIGDVLKCSWWQQSLL